MKLWKTLLVFVLLAGPWVSLAHADEPAEWAWSWFNRLEFRHTSSILDGIPFNHLPETQTDLLVLELFKACKGHWYIRGEVAMNTRYSELRGRDPHGGFAAGFQREKC